MIEEKTTALLGPKARPFLIAAAIFSALALAFLARLAQADVLKIALIHGACVCVMFMIVACKNYLSKIEILIFCFLGVQFLASAPRPEALNPFVASHYFFSYRYGVSSRSLAATILDFFTGGGFVSATLLWHFITGATALLAFAISSFIAAAMRGVSGEAKIFAVFIIFLWLSSFVAPAFYFTVAN
ncbi:MAG: hypothetical protein FWE09_08385, partial [Treponema sp.]|nr:hypothetical protein [Treponema sp.]